MKKIALLMSFVMAFGLSAHAQDDESSSSSKIPVPTGKYITGGVIGSVVGLGIGHGIQGRYNTGWIFTATEAASLGVLVAGLSSCKKDDITGDIECSNKGAISLGYLGFLGFHIWEIVDVWVGATPVDNEATVMLVPDNNGTPRLGMAWTF